MSDLLTKLLSGFIILVVIVAAITAFRADMLSGGAAYDAFTAVFDCFPFASETAQVAANIGQYGTTLQGLSPSNFINDVTKIFAMTIVCPLLIGAACRLFRCICRLSYRARCSQARYCNSRPGIF